MPVFKLESSRSRSPRPERTGGATGTHWWLVRDDETVAYGRTVNDPREEVDCILLELEVLESARGQGLTKELVSRIEAATNTRLYTDGHWTLAGSYALASVPLAPGYTPEPIEYHTVFVSSWEERLPRYL